MREALTRQFQGDLVGAAALHCAAAGPFEGWTLPITIVGVFAPTGPFDVGSLAETLALYEFDTSGLRVEDLDGGSRGRVALTGVLVERVDPIALERAVRGRASVTGDVIDEAALADAVALVSAGPIRLMVDEVFDLALVDGQWRICGPFPSPARENLDKPPPEEGWAAP